MKTKLNVRRLSLMIVMLLYGGEQTYAVAISTTTLLNPVTTQNVRQKMPLSTRKAAAIRVKAAYNAVLTKRLALQVSTSGLQGGLQ